MPTVTVEEIPVDKIKPSPTQARKDFDLDALKTLAESIKEHDLQQPINVRPVSDGYELVAGERRLRAVKLLGSPTIKAIVQSVDDAGEAAVRGLIENLQREDLNPIEEAQGYTKLQEADPKRWTQEAIGSACGKGQTYVSDTLRILKLPDEIQKSISREILSRSHGEALLSLMNPSDQIRLANQAIKDGWSVRQTEQEVNKALGKDASSPKGHKGKGQAAHNGDAQPHVPDPLADVWAAAIHDLDNHDAQVYWEATYGNRKIPQTKGMTLNGWTFTVNPMIEDQQTKELARWLYQMSQAVAKKAKIDPTKTILDEKIEMDAKIAELAAKGLLKLPQMPESVPVTADPATTVAPAVLAAPVPPADSEAEAKARRIAAVKAKYGRIL